MQPPLHPNEDARLQAVYGLNILDTEPDPRYDAVTQKAVEMLHVPISTISIIDKDREWYKSCRGLDVKQGEREIAFCSWALLSTHIFVVTDTLQDERFKNNPYVIGPPYVRFYAGVAILDQKTHLPIGVLCVKDTKPRQLSPRDIQVLIDLGKEAEELINKGHQKKIVGDLA